MKNRKHNWLILTLVVLLGTFPLYAVQYYVNTAAAEGGDGTTQALTGANCAWNQISDIAGLAAGDTVSFNKGNTWREQLTVPSSGSAGNQITFNAYGSGADPIINGSDLVTTWTEDQTVATWGENSTDDNTGVTVDTYILSGDANANFDADGQIKVKQGGGNFDFKGLVSFDLSALSGTVTDVDFMVYCITDVGDGGIVTLYVEGDAWVEATATWNNYDGANPWSGTHGTGVALDTLVTDGSQDNSYQTFNAAALTTYVNAQQGSTASFILWKDDGDNFWFEESEGTDTNRPYLSITAETANVWKATCTTEPEEVFFDGTRGTEVVSVALCNGVNKWYWAANVLYCYSTSDPDTAYTSPGIEATIRKCIYGTGKSYITIDGLELKYGQLYGIYMDDGSDITVQNCTGSWTKYVIGLYNNDNIDVNNNTLHDDLWAGIDCYNTNSGVSKSNWDIYENTVYNSAHAGINIKTYGAGSDLDDVDVYRNLVYDSVIGIYFEANDGTAITNIDIYYNIIHSCSGGGIVPTATGAPYPATVKIYNNVVYNVTGNCIGGDFTSGLIKNNILYESAAYEIDVDDQGGAANSSDYNCLFNDSAVSIKWDNTIRTYANFKALDNQEADGINTDPLMTDPANGDLALQSTSPCIDAGVDVSLTEDYNSVSVPLRGDMGTNKALINVGGNLYIIPGDATEGSPDIGAYEYIAPYKIGIDGHLYLRLTETHYLRMNQPNFLRDINE